MRRDATGKFTSNWDLEAKRRVSITLTGTAWQLLDAEAQKYGISRSEVIERTARGYALTQNQPSQAHGHATDLPLLPGVHASVRVGESREQQGDREESHPLPSSEEVQALRQRLRELEQSHRQGQQLIEQLSQQCRQERIARQQAEDRLHLTLNSARMIAWEMDLRRNYVMCSPHALAIWGIQEGRGEDFFALIHPDDRQQVMQAAKQAIADETNYFQEYRVLGPGGVLHWLSSRGKVYLDEQGQGLRIVGISVDVTAHKQTEAALRQSEEQLRVANERFQLAAKAVSCLIYDWRLDQDRVERTDGLTRLLGYSLAEAEPTGQWWRDRIHPDDLQAIQDRAVVSLMQEDYFTSEYRILNKSNQYIHVMDQCLVAERDAEGNPIRIVGSTTDISEQARLEAARKQAEVELQQREQEFRALVENTPDIIVRYDRHLKHLYINPSIERAVGVRPEQFIGKTGVELGFTDARSQTWCATLKQVFETGQSHSIEHEFPNPDGELRFYQAHIVPELIEGDQIKTVVGVARDVTEYKRTDISLRQSEERYRYLAESIPQLVWTADAEGVLIDVNQRWSTFTGLTLAQAHTEGWAAIVHPDDVPILSENWAIAQHKGTDYQAEGRIRRADGVYRWHLHQAKPFKNHQGDLIKWFGTATDIDDQKQLEQQRLHLLQQEQTAREQAEAANRIKDEFLAVLSHELRTPLNPILGWARLLRTRKLASPTVDHALETIERNARIQAQLIEDLLDISRILQGKIGLNASPINLGNVIKAALETVQLSADAKGIKIQTIVAPEMGLVNGDANRLQQVVWNLLSNAVKFTPSGGRIEVKLESVAASALRSQSADASPPSTGDSSVESRPLTRSAYGNEEASLADSPQVQQYAQITVSDTGQGIRPDFLPYVFEYFRQADSSTTRQFGGLGLGLAIVRHLVELHGGTVHAESSGSGRGATFKVQLPLWVLEHRPASEVRPHQKTQSLNGVSVLIVDDEVDMRDLMRFILEEQGARVGATASAAEALQQLDTSVPDVLISDIGMPEMDGYELMRQIRRRSPETGGTLPAIALTAYAGEYDRRQALTAGFHQHISKPVEPEALVDAIVQVIHPQSTAPS